MQNGWYKNGLKTGQDVENYFAKQEKINGFKKEISSALRINRPLNSFEEEYVSKWTNEYGYGMDVISIALKRSVLKSNAGFKYYDELLTDWHTKELRTPEEVEKHLASLSDSKTKTKQVQNAAKQFEYTQSTFDNFENLYEN